MIKNIEHSRTRITGGFWKEKQDMIKNVTADAVYDRFDETGRINAFKCQWKEGEPLPHVYWDSDVAKWMEGAAYITGEEKDAELEAKIDALVDDIEKNQREDGYFNIRFITSPPCEPFTNRELHELYCAGHLIEAAVAYYQATGKKKMLDCMCRYADYIEKRFKIYDDTGFSAPGHEEIELALVRLYECVGDKRYLELAKHFIDIRGTDKDRSEWDIKKKISEQSHMPVREQTEAVGHAVRAVYLYSGMADVAYHTKDRELFDVCRRLFDNIINKRMYITGGIGSSSSGEAFTQDFELSNMFAYAESCAAIGLAFFAHRMQRLEVNSKYGDIIERVLYNGFLSSTSLDGRSFFYENPLETDPRFKHRNKNSYLNETLRLPMLTRASVFSCSCCPPNIVRFIPSIANMLYSDDGEVLYVHQFMQSETDIERKGKNIRITQITDYPEDGNIKIKVEGSDVRLAVRVPSWCDGYEGKRERGYAFFDVKDGEILELDFEMRVKFIESRPELIFNCGRFAVTRGPIVYCMESTDNGEYIRDIRIDPEAEFKYGRHKELGVPELRVKAYRRACGEDTPIYSERHESLTETEAILIPYNAFANRGESEMQVWHLLK